MVSCEKRRLIRTRYFHKICYKNFMLLLLEKKKYLLVLNLNQ